MHVMFCSFTSILTLNQGVCVLLAGLLAEIFFFFKSILTSPTVGVKLINVSKHITSSDNMLR